MISEINISDYIGIRSENDILVDLRSKIMYELGTISGAINIPAENVKELYKLPKDKNIYLFCQIGEISGEFAELLSDSGYNVYNLIGGYREYLRVCGE
ncbi:MAG: rhodanese-like domain-containing protein [Oscillospiraceae bacterium]|nr:rhodanese-like domain-containing protein [Oscillospiraceae bacterium]